MLIGKELLEKVDELKKLGHDDQFIFSACGYSNEDSFNTAFSYSKNAKPKLNTEHYSTSKLDSEIGYKDIIRATNIINQSHRNDFRSSINQIESVKTFYDYELDLFRKDPLLCSFWFFS